MEELEPEQHGLLHVPMTVTPVKTLDSMAGVSFLVDKIPCALPCIIAGRILRHLCGSVEEDSWKPCLLCPLCLFPFADLNLFCCHQWER